APAGRRVRPSVSLLDVAPTILDAVGVPAPAAMEGKSLLPLLRADGADRPAFAQTYYGDGLVGVRLGRMKYVFKARQAGVGARPIVERRSVTEKGLRRKPATPMSFRRRETISSL